VFLKHTILKVEQHFYQKLKYIFKKYVFINYVLKSIN
jgi:hypothetical protein